MVTQFLFCYNFNGAPKQKTSLTKVVKEYEHIREIKNIPQHIRSICQKYSFCHNLTSASKQKTSSTKVVKEYAHIKEI